MRSNFALKARRERVFWMQRQGAKNHHEKGRMPAETKVREASGRKSPQNRPIWRRLRKGWFAETGWWCAQSTTNRSRPRICLISGFLQGIFANCCLLSENAREFTASIQSLANSFPKNRNRRLEAANRVSWLIIRAEHNLEQATLTQGSKARNPAPHFTW